MEQITAKGYNGQITFDGRWVTITRRGLVARTSIGKGEKRIPIEQITAVQFKPAGIVNGFLQLTLPGGVERRSRLGHQTSDAMHDENTVVFTRRHRAEFAAMRDALQAAM